MTGRVLNIKGRKVHFPVHLANDNYTATLNIGLVIFGGRWSCRGVGVIILTSEGGVATFGVRYLRDLLGATIF